MPLLPISTDDPFFSGTDNVRHQSARKLFCVYDGPSMYPTLKTGDLLEVVPYADVRPPAPGDVILCIAPIAHRYVIHRIIAATPAGFRTRGDNCSMKDPWLLTAEEIIGKVVAASSKTERRAVLGGKLGRILIMHRQLLRQALSRLTLLVRPLSGTIRLHPAKKILSPFMQRRLQLYNFGPRGLTVYRLMAGRKTIGVYEQEVRRWRIRMPYRLLLDESVLPHPGTVPAKRDD